MEFVDAIDLLIVDDDPDFRSSVSRRFLRRGYNVHEASDGEEALGMAQRRDYHVAIIDLMMPGMSGLELLHRLKKLHHEAEVVLLTGQGSIETAVEAMKAGACDYVTKPFPLAELEVLVQKAHERRLLRKENQQLRAMVSLGESHVEMIGKSPTIREVFRLIERAGPSDKAILIQGESGTGKELVARALHKSSPRRGKPMVVVNCASLPEFLQESELFGHEKGAFTGAVSSKPGLFEVADGGTLMIDEIGEMSGPLQAKLLRVLEDGSMRRIGSIKERKVNVRLLAATNRNMMEEVKAGRFREDLYYRINVMSLEVPPLRERPGDIPLLVAHFLTSKWQIEPEALEALGRYDWPGNIRQLANAIERARIMSDEGIIRLKDLPSEVSGARTSQNTVADPEELPLRSVIGETLADIEKAHVLDVLRQKAGNKARTARALGINRRSLYRLLDKYDIRNPSVSL